MKISLYAFNSRNYCALHVANYFLFKGSKFSTPINPIKLMKLVYMAYKSFLNRTSMQLFSERIESWDYGPIVPSVYYEFREFRRYSINRYAEADRFISQTLQEETDRPLVISPKDKIARDIIDDVFMTYRNFDESQLIAIDADKQIFKNRKKNNSLIVSDEMLLEGSLE